MSEFKYACPVCGQHIKCDSSQAGTVMECPTCFQKITVPQAPKTESQKFILTGSLATEKKILVPGALAGAPAPAVPPKKSILLTVLVLAAVLAAAGAAVYFLGANRFFPRYNWMTSDIGHVRLAGNFSQERGVLTVTGDGGDIWYQADAFRYVYLQLDGDGEITARVLNQDNTAAWAKAGLMFRDTLKPESKYVLLFVSPSSGLALQQRRDTAGPASPVSGASGAAPCWLRLTRQGNNFTAYDSRDGTTWVKLGETTVVMGTRARVGLAVCSHNDNALCRAQFDHVTVNGRIAAATAK